MPFRVLTERMRFLTITLGPDILPTSDEVQRVDVINNRYLTDGSVIELSCIEGDLDDIGGFYEGNPNTIDYEVLTMEDDLQYVYHHFRPDDGNVVHQLIRLLDEYRLLVVYPMRFGPRSGATVTVMGTTEMVQQAHEQLPPEARQHITIDKLTESMPPLGGLRSILTGRQREVLDAAIELGYYSVPRLATADDVADVVQCAPSTAAEHLRKIEARVMAAVAR